SPSVAGLAGLRPAMTPRCICLQASRGEGGSPQGGPAPLVTSAATVVWAILRRMHGPALRRIEDLAPCRLHRPHLLERFIQAPVDAQEARVVAAQHARDVVLRDLRVIAGGTIDQGELGQQGLRKLEARVVGRPTDAAQRASQLARAAQEAVRLALV